MASSWVRSAQSASIARSLSARDMRPSGIATAMPTLSRLKCLRARRNGARRLSKEAIFEAVDRFYRAYYLRPKPILRIIKTMMEDKDVFVRRCREGYEFFRSLHQRQEDLAAARGGAVAAA